jgi:hypothetical protein
MLQLRHSGRDTREIRVIQVVNDSQAPALVPRRQT